MPNVSPFHRNTRTKQKAEWWTLAAACSCSLFIQGWCRFLFAWAHSGFGCSNSILAKSTPESIPFPGGNERAGTPKSWECASLAEGRVEDPHSCLILFSIYSRFMQISFCMSSFSIWVFIFHPGQIQSWIQPIQENSEGRNPKILALCFPPEPRKARQNHVKNIYFCFCAPAWIIALAFLFTRWECCCSHGD